MKIHLPRSFITIVLGLLYILSFVVTPFWLLGISPFIKVLLLIMTLCLGVIWSNYSADSLQIQINTKNKLVFGFFLLVIIILNFRPLTSVIPWRGDEDFHISNVLFLLSQINILWIIVVFVLFFTVLHSAWYKPKLGPITLGLTTIIIILLYTYNNPFDGIWWILRYPLLNYWIFMLFPKFVGPLFSPYHEIFYRIVPLFCMVAVAWTYQREIPLKSNLSKLLWGLSISTMPIVYYYSSILYIEPMAVILMFVVCIQAKDLLYVDYSEIKKNPAWYALIFLGFIKETVIPFLLCYLVCRLIIQYNKRKSEKSLKQKDSESLIQKKYTFNYFMGEIKISFSVLIPYLFYLILRSTLSVNRIFTPGIQGLINISVYRAIVQSFFEQFGLLAILFCVGCILLYIRREYATLFFLLIIIISFQLFYVTDQKGIYAGYSRFNLFILPSILAGTLISVKYFIKYKKAIEIIIPSIIICINLWITPINLDGTKKPLWGNYLIDTSEHYYPYRIALSWVHDNYDNASILSTSLNYPYYFEFYFEKLNWYPKFNNEKDLFYGDIVDRFNMYFNNSFWIPKPRIEYYIESGLVASESEFLSRAIDIANQGNYELILYPVLVKDIPQTDENSEFQQVKIITNDAHTLVIYARVKN